MGRLLFYDDHVKDLINNMIKEKNHKIGLVFGQNTLEKDFVVHLTEVPAKEKEEEIGTEQNSEELKSSKNTTKKRETDELDEAWISQHGKQVTRMLPGGLEVLGIFFISPVETYINLQPKLRQILFALNKALSRDLRFNISSDSLERILLHICPITNKITSRTFDVSDYKSTAKPADFKYQSSPFRWHRLNSRYTIDAWIPVSKDQYKQNLLKQIHSGLSPSYIAVINATALIDREMREDRDLLDPAGEKKKGKQRSKEQSAQKSFDVDLFLSLLTNNNNLKEVEPIDCVASMVVKGTIQCRGYVHSKATVADAIRAVKQDIIRSLMARCEIQCEDLLLIEEEQNDPSVVHELPRRVFAPLSQSELTVCDYLFQGDSAGDCLNAFQDLLGLNIAENEVEMDCECAPISLQNYDADVEERLSDAEELVTTGAKNLIVPVISAAVAALAAGLSYLLLQDT
ncbi:protein odr-4 homolog [Limulus polyphemus]|uniref:Protein odr-4 homolog n=1 Tax=Limulus polyphemus TaxID=6850 RepID=A0ABM1BFL6_LIMPO|nr:protein odr-4 homolog [Limulus polyphemus]